MNKFGEILEARCKNLGISQRQAAKKIGISPSYLTALKKESRGNKLPKKDKIRKIAQALEISEEVISASLLEEEAYIGIVLSNLLYREEELRSIVEWWQWTTKRDKKKFYALFNHFINLSQNERGKIVKTAKRAAEAPWKLSNSVKKFAAYSQERANFIWESTCEELHVKDLLNRSAFSDSFTSYTRRKITDKDFYEEIKSRITEILSVAKTSNT